MRTQDGTVQYTDGPVKADLLLVMLLVAYSLDSIWILQIFFQYHKLSHNPPTRDHSVQTINEFTLAMVKGLETVINVKG